MCTKWNLQVAVKELEELFADKEKLVLARQTAQDFVKKHSVDESWIWQWQYGNQLLFKYRR